ncbi:MAG: TrkH family potassium uptake protein [Clostridia bacterium]|nr:TrkH family potassium uptake protein [Clostridia bacterium]
MNYRIVSHTVGRILQIEAVLMLLPLAVSIIYVEQDGAASIWAFLISIGISLALGLFLTYVLGKNNKLLFAREGFAIVALAWLAMSAVGALPFVISGYIPSFVDAFFETVSGFTTTGASILTDVEALSHGMLFWRSFTHWVGGMGVLVFIMAILPQDTGRNIHIMRAEMPGPIVGKLVPRLKDTARILYIIYIAITAIEVVFLLFGGMDIFESLVHSFGTAGTGGFGIKGDSLGSYNAYLQWVITIFMLIFGVNFNLYYLILIKQFKTAVKSTELWVYGAIVLISGAAITINILGMYDSVAEAVRHAFFQVATVITTTGYSSVDFNLWPGFSKAILVVLMFVGGCAGSTAGGIKVSRFIIALKTVFRDIKKMLHPRSVAGVKLEGKKVDDSTINSVSTYFAFYFIILLVIFLLISLEPFSFEANFTATVACFNNIGPGLAEVGPMGSFAAYSAPAKVLLSFAMLLGRLEIFPLLLIFTPSMWKKK